MLKETLQLKGFHSVYDLEQYLIDINSALIEYHNKKVTLPRDAIARFLESDFGEKANAIILSHDFKKGIFNIRFEDMELGDFEEIPIDFALKFLNA